MIEPSMLPTSHPTVVKAHDQVVNSLLELISSRDVSVGEAYAIQIRILWTVVIGHLIGQATEHTKHSQNSPPAAKLVEETGLALSRFSNSVAEEIIRLGVKFINEGHADTTSEESPDAGQTTH